MKESARYAKIVEWSDEDQCYVGSSPGLIYGGCHGADETEVFEELCRVVEEATALYHVDGKPLPPQPPVGTSRTRCRTSRRSAVRPACIGLARVANPACCRRSLS